MKLIDKFKLCYRILIQKSSNLLDHAERELPPSNGDEMQELMNSQLKEIVLLFSTHGHSGFSSSYAIKSLEKLLRYEPLRPLTGDDSEWFEYAENRFQNKRCSHVFKEYGIAYDSAGKVFIDKDGCSYTSKDSRVEINFPYVPKVEYINVD